MTRDEIVATVVDILRTEYGNPGEEISAETKINKGMGIHGDDAGELIERLERELKCRIDFEFGRYFYGEGLFQIKRVEDLSVADLASYILDSIHR